MSKLQTVKYVLDEMFGYESQQLLWHALPFLSIPFIGISFMWTIGDFTIDTTTYDKATWLWLTLAFMFGVISGGFFMKRRYED